MKIEGVVLERGYESIKKFLVIVCLLFAFPIGLSFLLGYEMQANQIQHIPMAIVDYDGTSFSRMLIEEVRTNEIFDVQYYPSSDQELKQLMDENKIRVGLMIPTHFQQDMSSNQSTQVLILYDGSQMSITGAAKVRMSEILLSIKTGFIMKVMEGKSGILPSQVSNSALPMYFNYRIWNNPTRNYNYFLLPPMLLAVIQVCLVMLGVLCVEKHRKYVNILWRHLLYGVLGGVSIGLTLGVQIVYFNAPYRGHIAGGVLLTLLFSIGMVGFGLLVRLIIPQTLIATQLAAIAVLPSSILGGLTWPLMAMPESYQKFGGHLPYVHYTESLRNLMVKDIGWEYIQGEVGWMSHFVFLMVIGSLVLYFLSKAIPSLWRGVRKRSALYGEKLKHKNEETVI